MSLRLLPDALLAGVLGLLSPEDARRATLACRDLSDLWGGHVECLVAWRLPDHAAVLARMAGLSGIRTVHVADCREAWTHAARNGHLALLEWLHRNRAEGCSEDAMDWAARNGHLEVVQWLHRYRAEGCSKDAMMGPGTT
jgi:hypothetical protein